MSPIPLGILAASGITLAGAYDLLETQVLTSNASSVSFTGLGSYTDYKHLQLRMVGRNTSNDGTTQLQFNSDTGSNYSYHGITGYNSNVLTDVGSNETRIRLGRGFDHDSNTPSQSFGAIVVDILDFSNTSKNTTIRALSGRVPNEIEKRINFYSGAWYNTAAVTSMTIFDFSGDHKTGSRFSLYGVK